MACIHFSRLSTRASSVARPGLVLSLVATLLAGCASVGDHHPVPEKLVSKVTVPGFSEIRYSYDSSESAFVADYGIAMRSVTPGDSTIAVLALSGGGANGAYCAGLLCGWTKTGTRPQFQVVTGVSTGALAAPFAFLGAAYDERLRQAYTQVNDSDIFAPHVWRSAFMLFRGDSVANTSAMTRLLARLIDQPMLDAIAAEHRSGRRLYVCTTELVSGRATFWNLGAIAASDQPARLELFRKILIASASIPIAFPPLYLEVEADGARYTEMHVDGGLSRQIFLHLHGARKHLASTPGGESRPLTAYIIRNAKTAATYEPLRPRIGPIAVRTMQALIRAEGIGDLHRIYEQTTSEQAAYRLAVIPADFPHHHEGVFNAKYMASLFETARHSAVTGYPWQEKPPYYDVALDEIVQPVTPVAP
jgi:predicted patatin/cPLA2 family phospholipase